MNGTNGSKFNVLTLVSVVCSVVASTWLISSRLSTAKTDIIRHSDEEDAKMTAVFTAAKVNIEARITALEARPSKETWTDGDMFRWATRLQRENPNLRVPEPPMKGDSR